jgi:hypothetical protein
MAHRRMAALILAATAVSACGSGGTTKSLTRADLIGRADAICGRINAQISAHPYRTRQAIARLASQQAAYEHAAIAELSALVPPVSVAADWKQIIADARTLADDTAKLAVYAKANNLKSGFALVSSDAPVHARMLALAKRNGFKECSRPG